MNLSLSQLGWQAFFQQQLSLQEFEQLNIARLIAHHRNEYVLASEQGKHHLALTAALPVMTIGDWLLLNTDGQFVRLLERKSVFKRKAAGSQLAEQLISANVDTLLIVSSLNQDFKLSRIERYLTLAYEAGVDPVVVLTKLDLCHDAEEKHRLVQQLDPMLIVESVNALDDNSCKSLLSWCKPGKTLAVMGSSGVGKSTLVNTLSGEHGQKTAAIREDDSKGRHTTTARSMHFLPAGAVLIDTPGMRELQLSEGEDGIRRTFADIDVLAEQCRFKDCQHMGEPGCAVELAINSGELDPRRLVNYHKLQAELRRNRSSLQERRAKDREFGKMIKRLVPVIRHNKKGY
ncbi:ribosome small subunit-dependent GTPase A [Bowmanella pacifica]|uniref:Small ribosomal subunit biogenesis GTPase RsgA n=1 Tax=Bowmanella pacifica TaxID=502051 RepID=A0A917Z4A7_9ALTE|nr:ribosome small subunit-dependent GTPase A [Bowmanella pacifica]GGO74705.1 putative ribosome biogenesis GTPase RsgA 2 [Bowmanella pacifica]